MQSKTLADMCQGEKAVVTKMMITGSMRRRVQDIGLIVGTEVECVGKSPMGDPAAYLIRGAVIALRQRESSQILVGEYQTGMVDMD